MSNLTELADIHCHLMPYVDDGAYDREECVALLRMEAEQGVRSICLTPHLRSGMFETEDGEICQRFEQVREWAAEQALPLTLYHSREYHYDRLFLRRLDEDRLRPLGNGRFLLLEFGGRHQIPDMLEAISLTLEAGYTPLIAHVERYEPLHRDWTYAQDLRDAGAYLQINAGSVLGKEGMRQRMLCGKLLRRQLVHVIASDAHDTRVRVPELGACAHYLERKLGREYAQQLLCDNPKAVLQGAKENAPCSK